MADDKRKKEAEPKKKRVPAAAEPKAAVDDDKKPRRAKKKSAADASGAADGDAGGLYDATKEVGTVATFDAVAFDAKADDVLLSKQNECLMLLLEARTLFSRMVGLQHQRQIDELEQRRQQLRDEKKRAGRLTVTEIQEILRQMPEDEDFDWVTEMQKLRNDLAAEIRRNHVLDRKAQKLDKRIGLLIRNRTALETYLNEKKNKKKKKGAAIEEPRFTLEQRKLEYYQELFYLLQTEPRYLAKALYMIQAEEMDSFLETTILTLYGDAFSPREEFLILRLFKLAIQNEMSKIRSLSDYLKSADSVVPKMVITYNRRKLGLQYLRTCLAPILLQVMERAELSLELHPTMIYQAMINDMEIRTGAKSTLDRHVSEDEAMKNPEVKAIMKKRLDLLQEISQMFLDAIINSMDKLPYGIRWICKTIRDLAQTRFGEQLDQDQVLKVTGYFVYYRFINLGIVTPDQHKVVDRELTPVTRKNLVVVGKVLQNLFNFRLFGDQSPEKYMKPLNAWIDKNKPMVEHYFATLIKVDDPEDHLQVNRYNELTQKTKPVIQVSLQEITHTHKLLLDNLDSLAESKDDELRVILNDLGECPPVIDEDSYNNREIQLTLVNRFKVDVDEDDEIVRLYAETKELVIPVLRTIPVESSIHRLHLTDVLESGIKYAQEKDNRDLLQQIERILENIAKLEKAGRLSKADKYQNFVHEISIEVANRNAVREQQKREVARLKGSLEELRGHQTYVQEQIDAYKQYLQNAKTAYYSQQTGKKKGKEQKGLKPVTFTYKELEKKGVIIDSAVPPPLRGRCKIIISSEDYGTFEVTAKAGPANLGTVQLELDDLLEKHYNGIEKHEFDQPEISLDVNMTIFLINAMLKK